MIRVFLVDDHEIVREGLKKVLNRQSDIKVIGYADSGQDAIRRIRSTDVDVVILDITLPDLDGLEVLNRILGMKNELSVLIYTMHEEDPLAIPFLKAGAKGFLTKGDSTALLIEGIRQVNKNKKYITPRVGEVMLENWQQCAGLPSHNTLTNREFTVFRLLASGKNITTIAKELSIAKSTVCTHRKRILDKMGLENNASLMRYAIERNIT
ncbi:MAG: response regulator transcription factor [Magnetococcales bacterium]|nr:response regulator transcription factor [Magnetococcales bacterium]